MPCTTILVGKDASFDGSTIIGRNDDSPSGVYMPKKFVVVKPEDQPRLYKSVLSHVEIELPDNPMRYTCMPNAVEGKGIWGAAGVNAANVAMTATETITSNERVLGADPLVKYQPAVGNPGDADYQPEKIGGIGEEDYVTLVLPYINSAREGVLRVAELLEKYGTYEMNGMAFSDTKEIWWLETIGGHHYIARRVPDDAYVTMPNQFGLDHFDFEDAFGDKEEFMCSADLWDFIEKYHLNLTQEDDIFNPRDAFGSHADSDHIYNTPRSWMIQRFFNPNTCLWDGIDADYTPLSDDLPWCQIPEKKITVEDVKYCLAHHFQGTEYDVYSAKNHGKAPFRPIGVNRTDDLAIIQLRPYPADGAKAIEWLSFGSNVFNASIPMYANINDTPDYFKNTTGAVTSENIYWVNRIIAALADAHFAKTSIHIERYKLAVQSKGYEIINRYDAEIAESGLSYEDSCVLCEKANSEIATMVKEETDKVLNNVLYEASNNMKNSFARSDA